ncbi:MAG: hypothetical protein H6747_00975 [Deltaproteobacteria bacterium]|nr:hypothetical protein [Deltaproteobacteria bacterium]
MQVHDNRDDNRTTGSIGRTLRRAGLAMLGLGMLGCSAPTAGMWQGTADIGPIDAFPLVVMLPAEAPDDHRVEGEVELRLASGPQRYTICSGRARNGNLEFEIDWSNRSCKTKDGAKADRRVFRGRVGEGVIAGAIWKGTEQVGFFRAYRPSEG